ncbi:MAG: glutamate-5-semialdehyde dehydrogenase [Clostridiales bacterium]|jgi:glutamate-5-semialdehyde dehydrogenase|nr:glutamate-5-semialdehyde dehydrogenase [Clostridiales bacterium]
MTMRSVADICIEAKRGADALLRLSGTERGEMLEIAAQALVAHTPEILAANALDVAELKDAPKHLIDRLTLNKDRVLGMASGLLAVKALKDPVFETIESSQNAAGLKIKKVRVPFGVVGIIYEARPNVTADTVGLALKSGNAVILRGSKDALRSNQTIVGCIKTALQEREYPVECIQLITDPSHKSAEALMRARGLVDLLFPRGSAALIQSVLEKATVPVIETGVGNCHAYVHKKADLSMAVPIILNGKLQRPSVCNALESLLIDEEIAEAFLPKIVMELSDRMVEVVGCERSRQIVPGLKPAIEEDYAAEFLALKISVKIVGGLAEAIAHINRYGSHHSDVILTEDAAAAREFTKLVDSAAVYVNASTRFTDGGEFGMGAEIGISTQKLHARGPMGLKEMTTYKFIVIGEGQVRS